MSDNIVHLKAPARETSGAGPDDLRSHFFDILRHNRLSTLYQPIVDFQRQNIFGYESLIRGPSDSPLHSPVMLFDLARREEHLTELDLLCRKAGIQGFQECRLSGKLFLNATPNGLMEPQHRSGLTLEFLQSLGLNPENVVIEITEQYPLTDFTCMDHALSHYRAMGFEIAIDDLGAGYSGLRCRAELSCHCGRNRMPGGKFDPGGHGGCLRARVLFLETPVVTALSAVEGALQKPLQNSQHGTAVAKSREHR